MPRPTTAPRRNRRQARGHADLPTRTTIRKVHTQMTTNRKPARIFPALALVTLSLLASALGVLGGASAASAAPTPTGSVKVVNLGMYVKGFDAATAKAHGYQIVTYANGDRQSVPVDPQSKLA